MFRVLAIVLCLFSLDPALRADVKLPAEMKLRPNRLGKLEAVSDTVVRWINLHDEIDLIPDTSGKFAIVVGVKVGRYKIAAYTASPAGVPSEPAYCVIVIEGDVPPVPVPPAPGPGKPNAVAAICKLRFGNSGCTATIIGPQRADGRWDVLTASHCTGPVGSKGQITLKDGRTMGVTVAVRQTTADITWLIADTESSDLPFAWLAGSLPAIGTQVWHMGYGIDRPGNKEDGTVAAQVDGNGQLKFSLSVSSGDSGSGIFLTDNNEVVATVCCTSSMARKGSMWGGACTIAAKLRPSAKYDAHLFDQITPVEMPQRKDEEVFHPILILR